MRTVDARCDARAGAHGVSARSPSRATIRAPARHARASSEPRLGSVASIERNPSTRAEARITLDVDADSREWLAALRAEGPVAEDAVRRLHALLLRAARFEVARRRPMLPHVRSDESDDIALEAADDALVSVLARLDDFRGASRFSTWAYKFALLEAAVKLRRRAWQRAELPLEPESWATLKSGRLPPDLEAEQDELLRALADAIDDALTPQQRTVLVAVALNGVPIDVLAEQLGKTRGALYKTIHDARRKLRLHLREHGFAIDDLTEEF